MDADTHVSDAAIAAQSRTNKNAFAQLVARYQEKLLRYIRRLGVLNQEDAEDVLQNAFINAYRNLYGYDEELAFSSWMYRITHNEVMTFYRKKRIRPHGHYVENGEEALTRIKADNDTASLSELNLTKEQLGKALAELHPKYRSVLVLRYFEEREYKEISDILKIPPGTVGTLLHRAKKAIKRHLKDPSTL